MKMGNSAVTIVALYLAWWALQNNIKKYANPKGLLSLNVDIVGKSFNISQVLYATKINAKKNKKVKETRETFEKHPTSTLIELCRKLRWNSPIFSVALECGPPHKKQFIFKVLVNERIYQPDFPSENKKKAKADAASMALKELQHCDLVTDMLLFYRIWG